MLQDIQPNKLFNQYRLGACAKEQDKVFLWKDGNILVAPQKKELLPDYAQIKKAYKDQKLDCVYLFSLDDVQYFRLKRTSLENIEELEKTLAKEGYEYMDLRELRGMTAKMDKPFLFALYTAKHLEDWYRDNQFCGRCQMPMEHSTTERAVKCPKCGYTSYPRIMPAVIVGVTNGNRLLITRYREGYAHNALVAGFTEIGETVEETVAREVMEEAGIKVKNIRYYKSQPWGIANDILLGFYCDVDGEDEIHMDEGELRYAQWVERTEIELQPDDISLTNEMMRKFKEGAI